MKSYLFLFLWMALAAICPDQALGQVVTTIGGDGTHGYSGDGGPAVFASFNTPTSIVRDAAGNIYVNDQDNHCVRKINVATGIISTIAGTGYHGSGGDGGPATNAQLHANWGIAIDGANNIYIADQTNYRIRRVSPSGIITNFAGTGIPGDSGDGGPALSAQFERPIGIAVDAAGNVYVGDDNTHKVRKINSAGIITTVAGTGSNGYGGDGGPAISALLSNIWGLTTDKDGNLYICDGGLGTTGNHRIRKVDTFGIITTIAGIGSAGYGGDNGPATNARLYQPTGITVDNMGNLLIADCLNNRIRKINKAGIITTICGNGTPGFNGDGYIATSTIINQPLSVLADDSSSVYFIDLVNQRARKIHKVLSYYNGRSQHINVCENISTQIDSALAVIDYTTGKTDLWTVAIPPLNGTIASFPYAKVSTGGYNLPSGLSYTPYPGYVGNDSFVVNISNGVDTSFTMVRVSVNPKLSYAGVIEGPPGVCVGEAITLTDTTGNGIWSASNLNAVVAGGIVTGQSAGMVTITYTLTNACGSLSTTKDITVYPLPDAGKITGDSLICIGESVTLANSVGGGTWSGGNTNISVSSFGIITGLTEGKDTVQYTVNDGTCSNKATYVVTVDPVPTAQLLTGRTAICVGDTTLAIGIPEGGSWQLSNTNVAILDNIFTGIKAGIDTISYVFTNHCGTDTATTYITVYPVPATPSITQNESFIHVPDNYTSYQWLLDGAPISGAVTDSFIVSSTGKYAVVVANAYGCKVQSDAIVASGCDPDDILIYPNPAESVIHIQWCKPLTVRVLCIDGKEVLVKKNVGQTDLSDLPNGMYLLSIFDNTGHKVKTMKVVKNNTKY